MPCNESPSLCSSEGVGNGNNGVRDSHAGYPSSFNSNNSADSIEERRVSNCTNIPSPSSQQQSEQQTSGRFRTASTRSTTNVQSTFNALHPLPGEEFDNESWVDVESCRVFLTQFRVIVVAHNQSAMCAIPLTGIDLLEAKDIVGLQMSCKDGQIIKLRAENSEIACTWYKKLIQKTCIPRELDNLFAFKFYSHVSNKTKSLNWLRKSRHHSTFEELSEEFKRLDFGEGWRLSTGNKQFDICATYPQYLVVPASVGDDELKQMRFGRYYHRFPTPVWRYRKNGAVLLRSSQPTIGFFGMANDKDVNLYEKIRSAISCDPNKKFLIVDARSYTAAWANRAKGGGFEATDTYSNAEVVFMGLPNIHNIRYSFHQLRQLLNSGGDPNIYLQTLQSTLWLQYIGQLFAATERCLNALCQDGISVLVHCSDGWDRTTQIVSLCMLIVDPFYRTFKGFELLIQRQWVEFGHKFADRSGVLNGDDNEKSPVFLQFLDCVYQLWIKNSDQFQFNRRYLMKLVQHTFSGLFGTFLFNSLRDAVKHRASPCHAELSDAEKQQRCFQVWDYLGEHNCEFKNPAYNKRRKGILRYPKLVPELQLWRDAYCCTNIQSLINDPDDSLSLQQSNGTGSTQDLAGGSSEKNANSTLSRSQSAASLTSLEQNTSIHSAHGGSTYNFSIPNGVNGTMHLAGKLSESCSIGSISPAEWKSHRFLDVDGLSKVPVQLEDQMIERIVDRERELQAHKPAAGAPTPVPVREGYVNGKMLNGLENPTKRVRNESVDSSSFEMVQGLQFGVGECCRMKHSSHNSTSSLTSGICLPSSVSSTCTTLSSEYMQNGFGCKNEVLQEGVENDGEGIEMMLNS